MDEFKIWLIVELEVIEDNGTEYKLFKQVNDVYYTEEDAKQEVIDANKRETTRWNSRREYTYDWMTIDKSELK